MQSLAARYRIVSGAFLTAPAEVLDNYGCLVQWLERFPDKKEVNSSILLAPTSYGGQVRKRCVVLPPLSLRLRRIAGGLLTSFVRPTDAHRFNFFPQGDPHKKGVFKIPLVIWFIA